MRVQKRWGFNCKVGLFSRVERYILIIILLLIGRPDWLVIILAVGTWLTVVQRGIHVETGPDPQIVTAVDHLPLFQ